ncbi:MAG TPA: amino acid adenylation domain-containing protein, partial [Candidatus Deferrimicrobium sp.]|nr:amino acid adenylation domain-containing protein [Candidatus Deferrimicrobium sp.]
MFVNRHPDMKPGIPTFNMLRHPKEETTDICYILSQVGRLWMLGVEIDWPAFHAGEKRRRIALPTYPFEGNIYPVAKNLFKLDATSTQPVTCDSQLSLDGVVQPTQTTQPTRPARPHLDVPYRAPASPIEEALAKIWLDLLGYDRIGTRDNFFALNGDSLKAVIAISTIHKELGVKVPLTEFFALSTIGGLAQYISARKKHSSVARDIPPVEKREYYPLSPAQKRMFILNRMAQDSIAYNITSLIELHGEVDREKFQEIFRRVIQRHESLRTSFTVIDEEPVQRIHDTVEFEIEPLEIKNLRSFDLSKAPLLRVGLIQEDAGKYILLVDMHHIISDGTSMGVLVKDFMQLFKEEPVAPLTVQYKDYAYMRQNERNTERWQQQAVYWRRQLAGVLPVLNLTTDFPRPPEWDFAGRQSGFVLEKAETAALKALARTEDVTLYMVLLSIYTIMLARLAGQEELPVGAPMAGRGHVDTLPIIGMFINTLVLRCFPVMEKTYGDYLLELKTVVLAGLENQDYPFEDVVEEMVLSREAGRNPLFDVAFVLQNMDVPEIEIRDLKLIPHLFDSGVAKFDMALIVEELNDTLRFTFEYRTSLFTPETMVRLGHFFKQISSAAVADTLQKVGSIDMLSLEEKTKLLEEFNCTRAIIPEATLPDLFQQQVERTPDRVALVGAGEGEDEKKEEKKRRREEEKRNGIHLSYRELNKQSDRLAGLLIEKGVLPDTIVGIMMERSIDLIIGILGILKAGGAYMPIDPEYPIERINYILRDSAARIIISKSEIRNPKFETNPNDQNTNDQNKNKKCHEAFVLNFENLNLNSIKGCPRRGLSNFDIRASNFNSLNLAYVIYTSGSTGKPKGVMVNHRSLVNLCSWYHRYFAVTVNDRASQYTSPGFDASIWEIFPHLLNGAALYMIHNEIKLDIFALNRYFEVHCITTAFLPTQVCEQFMQISTCPLRILHAGGDKLHQFTPRSYKLYNIYGPTENTVAATFFPVEKWSPNISIGRPIANNYIYILNKNGKTLQPIGVPGELYIGGDGLARGYLNKPELTAEKFIDFHHSSFIIHHSNLYCTGDLAKWLPDGNIEFLGRIDYQVKIRGFRIELGEIENRLLSFKGINEAAILVKEDGNGNKYLCAYVVSEGKVNDSEWQEYLRAYLPDYMVPSHFVQLEKMPLTTNGKIDRTSLLEIDASTDTGNGNMSIYEPPADETEHTLVKIWAEILDLEKGSIGVHDDFFRLGGHSLRAMGLTGKIKKTFSIEIPLAVLFKTPYIRALAAYIRQSTGIAYCDIGPVEKKEYYALSPAQQRLYFLDRFETVGTGYHIPAVLEVSGTPNKERFEEIFRSLMRRHESLRTAFLTIDGNPVQKVYPVEEVPFFIEYRDKTSDGSSPADIEALMRDFVCPFDLSRPPLLRVCLVKIDRTTHLLLFDMHHIISDGTSMGILIREFTALYNGSALAPLHIQYKDFSEWQNNSIITGKTVKEEEYWLNLYAGEIPRLELPTDYPRPEVFDFKGETLEFNLDHP